MTFHELQEAHNLSIGGYKSDWQTLEAFYEDVARGTILTRLRQLGLGVQDNANPLQFNLLRRVIERLAVLYENPPVRWLETPSGAMASEADHAALETVYRNSLVNPAFQRADAMRALYRQCVIRYYPARPGEAEVQIRVFPPHKVLRKPSAICPEDITCDSEFALELDGAYEYWYRLPDDMWYARILSGDGHPYAAQPPFAAPVLKPPVQMWFDEIPAGRAWLPPRQSRAALSEVVNLLANDLWALVINQAHDRVAAFVDDPTEAPRNSGPGTLWVMGQSSRAEVLSGNPKLAEAQAIIEEFIRIWSLGEDLPTSEFDKTKQVVTGASLRVQERPLHGRRKRMLGITERYETEAYRHIAFVYGASPDKPPFSPVLNPAMVLRVSHAPLDVPTDPREIMDAGARGIALGTSSSIDLIQRLHGVSRQEAIRLYKQFAADREQYPTPATLNPEQATDGPADPLAGRNRPDRNGGNSSLDSLRKMNEEDDNE